MPFLYFIFFLPYLKYTIAKFSFQSIIPQINSLPQVLHVMCIYSWYIAYVAQLVL